MMFTVRANGGAPSGHACPSRTTMFSISRMMRMILDVALMMMVFVC